MTNETRERERGDIESKELHFGFANVEIVHAIASLLLNKQINGKLFRLKYR